jgi:hypothetical protein
MEKAQSDLQQLDKIQGGGQTGSSNFQGVMDAQSTQNVEATNQVQGVQESHKVLLQAKVNANLPSTRVGAAEKAQNSRLNKMLEGLIGGQDRMTSIMNLALSGRQFSPPELIGLQAGVYRFSQELELTSKVVEKATSGIKQTMNTQV